MNTFRRIRDGLHAHSRTRHLLEGLAVATLVGTLSAAANRTSMTERFEQVTLDWRFAHYAKPTPARSDIIVLEITDADLELRETTTPKMPWPWPREVYTLVLEWLQAAGARLVLFDLSFQDSNARNPEKDKGFADQVGKNGNVYVLATFNAPYQRFPDRIPALHGRSAGDAPAWMSDYKVIVGPLPELVTSAKGIVSPSYGEREKDADGVARRYPIGHAHEGKAFLSPAVALAADVLGKPVAFTTDGIMLGDRLVAVDEAGTFQINWRSGNRSFNPNRRTVGGVLDNAIARKQKKTAPVPYDPEEFRDKIVFIGASAEGLFDIKNTPLGKALGVEVHAAALDTLLSGTEVRRVPAWAAAAIAFLMALLAGVAGTSLRIRWLVPTMLFVAVAYVGSGFVLLGSRHVWLDLVGPVDSLFLATLGSALVNYAIEGRQKRDIRNKFGTYLTPEYVKLLEENPGLFKLGGEERVGTAFFSDLSGFTAMSEKMTAAELVARMNEYLTLMTRSIKRFKGTVDKYEGDAIVAFWNAPIVQPDHAVLACRAALDNQKELAGLRERWIKAYGVTVVARIGINTGRMIFGNMGSDDKFNYTMMGDPVNLASRLEGANKDYANFMMIGPDTYELVKDAMEVRELDLIKVKGKQIPVTVYELLCEKGQLDDRTKKLLEPYSVGLQAYRLKQFAAAERQFREALEIKPDDGPSKLYLERSLRLIEKPPEPGWTYIYEKKDK